MSCPTDEHIQHYVEGELPPRDAVEIREHIDGCESCQARREAARNSLRTALSGVEVTAAPPVGDASPAPPALDGPLEHGTVIGRYTILDRLGAGGMGVVYGAYDPKLDRRVALKFLTTDKTRRHASLQMRFLREAQAMAHLSHPNVVSVHDFGTLGDDVFIAMEFVDGQDLKQWLKEKPRGWRAVVDAMIAAGRGLAAAHSAGLIHRDIKPSNILMGRDGRARVMDFGLARNADAQEDSGESGSDTDRESALDQSLTQAGSVMGTPQYMAPEQRRGAAIDARADQFAFCVTLYRALFDQLPFDKTQQHRLALNVSVKPADPPTAKPVPAWLKRAVYRGLSLHPEDRYPSMEALLAALSKDSSRLGRRGVAIAAAVILLGAAAVAYPAVRFQRARLCAGMDEQLRGLWDEPRQKTIEAAFGATGKPYAEAAWLKVQGALGTYAREWVAARTEACEATLLRREASDAVLARRASCLERRLRELETVSSLFAKADARTVDNAVATVEGLTPVLGCVAESHSPRTATAELAIQSQSNALRTRLAQAKVLYLAARFDEVRSALETALPEAQRLGDASVLAQAMRLQGQVDFEAGHLDAAGDELRRAEWTAEGVADAEAAAEIADALVTLAYRQSQFDSAHLWANHARALIRAAGGDEGLESDVDVREAFVFRAEAQLDRAEETGQRAYTLRLARFGPESARVASALLQLSSIAAARGEEARALDYAGRAAAIFERAVGPDHPDTTTARGVQGSLLVGLGRCAEASELLEGALKSRVASNPTHSFLGLNHWDLGNLYRKLGDGAQAQAHYQQARERMVKDFGPTHRYVGSLLADVGRLMVQDGRAQDALLLQAQSLEILSRSPSPESGGPVTPRVVEGLAWASVGKWEKSLYTYAGAVTEGRRLLGPADPRLSEPLTGQAEAELALGRAAEALPLLRSALELRGDRAVDPAADARTRYALAQALWAADRHVEALRAAEAARSSAAKACNAKLAGLEAIDDWVRAHAGS